jgi:LL-diaminopimelate aminotransferase
MCAIYERRRDLVVDALRDIGVDVDPPKGTIYIWAPVPAGHSSTSFAELVLQEAAVVVSPGSMYGPSGEGFFRISLTTPEELLEEAVQRLRVHLAPESRVSGRTRARVGRRRGRIGLYRGLS